MTVDQLEELRTLMLDRIAVVPQFRRGSLQVGYRKCGKANCRCARPGELGHGPRGLWTRTAKGPGGCRGQYIPVEQVDQVRAELDNYARFAALIDDYVEVNEAAGQHRHGPRLLPLPALQARVRAAGRPARRRGHQPVTRPGTGCALAGAEMPYDTSRLFIATVTGLALASTSTLAGDDRPGPGRRLHRLAARAGRAVGRVPPPAYWTRWLEIPTAYSRRHT